MQRYNFYIVNKDADLNALAAGLYGGESNGFYETFLELNQHICPLRKATMGQTLYLPATNDDHLKQAEQIKNTIATIDKSTQHLTPWEKQLKAQNHDALVLAVSGSIVGASSTVLTYYTDKVKTIMEETDEGFADLSKDYKEGDSIQPFINLARESKFKLDRSLGSYAFLAFNRHKPFHTGVVDRLKIHLNLAKQGIVDPKLNVANWELAGWENFHIRINHLSTTLKWGGIIGITLGAASDFENTRHVYEQYGWSSEFGRSAFQNAGDFSGGLVGGYFFGEVAKYLLKKRGGELVICFGINALKRLAFGTVVAATLPEDLIVGGIAGSIFLGVSIFGGAIGSSALKKKANEMFTFFKKEYYKLL